MMNEENKIRILGIIPARGGSKGLPRKNIIDLCGKPLIAHAIQAAQEATLLDAFIVSTDDEEIQNISKAYGADVPFLRPSELATDGARDNGFLLHALEWVERERGWNPEFVVLLPPTSPSRNGNDIDNAIRLILDTGASSVRTAVHPTHFNPYKMWVENGEDGKISPLLPTGLLGLPRQEMPLWYMPVGIAYVMRADIVRTGGFWGNDVRVLPIPIERYTDIDEMKDLEEAAAILSHR